MLEHFHALYVLGLSILLPGCHLSSLPGVHVTRSLPRCFLSQSDTPNQYHISVNCVTFFAVMEEYSVVVSSLLLLVVCDDSVLSFSFHICTGETFDTTSNISCSIGTYLCCVAIRDFDVYAIGLSSSSRWYVECCQSDAFFVK